MKSGLEKYLSKTIAAARSRFKDRDRAVFLGGILSFSLVFPAVLFGFLLSCINYVLIKKGITNNRELRLVRVSILFGGISSCIWLLIIFLYAGNIWDNLFKTIILPKELLENYFFNTSKTQTCSI